MDWDSVDENDGGPTYMSLAASSYHPGGVNAVFGDGSVQYVKNSVDPARLAEPGDNRRRRGHLGRPVLSDSCDTIGEDRQQSAGRSPVIGRQALPSRRGYMMVGIVHSLVVLAALLLSICWGCGSDARPLCGRNGSGQG